jgi:tetratricopeptide (TPR) repeat protein
VVGAIEPEISKAEQDRAKRKSPGNLDAWDNYQRGLYHFYQGTLESIEESEHYFARAMELDPEFGAAYSMYARSFTRRAMSFFRDEPDEYFENALSAARRGVKLNPEDVSAHVAMGFALEHSDITAAVGSLEEALSLNPDSSLAHFGLGRLLTQADRPDRGVEHLQTALRLSPRDNLMGIACWLL